ncbi:MAG: hypothetical protein ACRDFS_01170, partial [Chloroflexota bacterium]
AYARSIEARLLGARGWKPEVDATNREMLTFCLSSGDVPKGFAQKELRTLNVGQVIREIGATGLVFAQMGWMDGCRSEFRRVVPRQSLRGLYAVRDLVGRFQTEADARRWYSKFTATQLTEKFAGSRYRLSRQVRLGRRASLFSATGSSGRLFVTSESLFLIAGPFGVFVQSDGIEGTFSPSIVVAMARTIEARLNSTGGSGDRRPLPTTSPPDWT